MPQDKGSRKIFFFFWQDFFGKYHSRSNLLNDLEHDFVVYLTRNTTNCVWLETGIILDDNEGKLFQRAKSFSLTTFFTSKGHKRFAVETDKKPLSIYNNTLLPTFIQSVYAIFQLLDLAKEECNTLDQTLITQIRLGIVSALVKVNGIYLGRIDFSKS